jgi:hypothetical protein
MDQILVFACPCPVTEIETHSASDEDKREYKGTVALVSA